ncbi:MAG: hypothetical protein H6720_09700 [Sandaracinus sp.]|nr:hypothetical protein [Sandaracinus sp.]
MDLEPAKYEVPKTRSFAPRFPWKWVLPIGLALVGFIGFYQWRERSRTHELKQAIAASYQGNVVRVRERSEAFRALIEGWIEEAAAAPPENWADPRLDLAGLHHAEGIYLRLHESHVESREKIVEGAQTMEPDAITRCLGLSPVSLRGFYERLDVLDPAWMEEVERTDDVLRLRVLQEQLENRIVRDFPVMLDVARADYFMLTIQHGEDRQSAPVDVFMWDLQRRTPLLKARVQARGTYIPARIAIGGHPTDGAQRLPERAGLVDCSIASLVRAVAGRPAAEVSSAMPTPPPLPSAEPEGEGAAEDGTDGTEGEPSAPERAGEGTSVEGAEASEAAPAAE